MRRFDSSAGRLALGAVMSATCLVIMMLLGVLGIGTYLGPLLGGGFTMVVGRCTDTRTALLHWLATGLLCLMLCPGKELALLYLALMGWYPLGKGWLDRLPFLLGILCKVLLFNAIVVAVYAGLLYLIYSGDLRSLLGSVPLTVVLLILGNLIFRQHRTIQ